MTSVDQFSREIVEFNRKPSMGAGHGHPLVNRLVDQSDLGVVGIGFTVLAGEFDTDMLDSLEVTGLCSTPRLTNPRKQADIP